MGIEQFRISLTRHPRVAFDTSVFIYHLEQNSKYSALADCAFFWLDSGASLGVASAITMTELLAKPYRETSEENVDTLYALLSTYPDFAWIPSTLGIAALAAKIRANYRLRTPDALQAATAVHAQATAFVTNDPIFRRIPDFDTLILDDFV